MSKYVDYLRSPSWKRKAGAAKRAAGQRCRVCNSPRDAWFLCGRVEKGRNEMSMSLKSGDKVVVVATGWEQTGQRGTIEGIFWGASGPEITVILDSGQELNLEWDDIRKEEPPA